VEITQAEPNNPLNDIADALIAHPFVVAATVAVTMAVNGATPRLLCERSTT
jgi:hypothetical protein